MYPVLFRIYGFDVDSFWAAVLVGFLIALGVARSELRRNGRDPLLAYDLIFAAYIGGFIGARVFLVFTAWDAFLRDPFELLFTGSGWVWQGGVMGGAVAVIIASRRVGLPLGEVADLSGPCLAIGQAIGRIGCQLSGDGDYGVPSELPWAMSYPGGVVPTFEHVHPTPLYEAALYLIIFVVLWRRRGRMRPRGGLFGQYLVFTGLGRFAVEFVRRNAVVALGLTLAQWISMASVVIGAGMLIHLRSNSPEQRVNEEGG